MHVTIEGALSLKCDNGTCYRFVISLPSTWGFILACILLRVVEGAGTAMFFTAVFATVPKLCPDSVTLVMVRTRDVAFLTEIVCMRIIIWCREFSNLLQDLVSA